MELCSSPNYNLIFLDYLKFARRKILGIEVSLYVGGCGLAMVVVNQIYCDTAFRQRKRPESHAPFTSAINDMANFSGNIR